MKKIIAFVFSLLLMLSLVSCAAPNDNPGGEIENTDEFFCYSYSYSPEEYLCGERKITEEILNDAYWAFQEKSEVELPKTLTVKVCGKEYSLSLDPASANPSNKSIAQYRPDDADGKYSALAVTDFYGNIISFIVPLRSDEVTSSGTVYDSEKLKEIARNAAAEHWNGLFDIENAKETIHMAGKANHVAYFRVTYQIMKNGYVAAKLYVTIDEYGNIESFDTSSPFNDIQFHADKYPDFDTEKMRAAADRYVLQWYTKRDKAEIESATVTVHLVDFCNGQYGLRFEYMNTGWLSTIQVIVTPEEYANSLPIEN